MGKAFCNVRGTDIIDMNRARYYNNHDGDENVLSSPGPADGRGKGEK